ncbi:MAG: type VI secretion protein IcmF/TssM N-terminal domain-containing protein [Maricaulaceae bacterium]
MAAKGDATNLIDEQPTSAPPKRRTADLGGVPTGAPAQDSPLERGAAAALTRIDLGKADKADRYETPWFLTLAPEGAAEPLLRAVSGRSFKERDGEYAAQGWFWWVMGNLVAIEFGADLVRTPAENPEAWRSVERAAALLGKHRPRRGLNGVIAVLPARVLQDTEAARLLGERLRAVVLEMTVTLDLDLPIHVIVTELDRLPGHAAFAAACEAGADTMLGHRFDPPRGVAKLHDAFDPVFDALAAQLDRVRLGLLLASAEDADRHGLFEWFERVRDLRVGLATSLRALLEEDLHQPRLVWRGLYLTAPGAPPGARMTSPIFERFLPEDSHWVRRRGEASTL